MDTKPVGLKRALETSFEVDELVPVEASKTTTQCTTQRKAKQAARIPVEVRSQENMKRTVLQQMTCHLASEKHVNMN